MFLGETIYFSLGAVAGLVASYDLTYDYRISYLSNPLENGKKITGLILKVPIFHQLKTYIIHIF